MKTCFMLLIAVSAYGCAMNPADLREKGIRAQYSMKQAPAAAAACVARNVESGGNAFTGNKNTSVREGRTPGHSELVIFSGEHYYVIADFGPDRGGSVAEAWASPNLLESIRNQLLTAFQGC